MEDDVEINEINLFLSILAYTGGGWSAEETIKAFEYLKKTAGKTRMHVVKPPLVAPAGEIH